MRRQDNRSGTRVKVAERHSRHDGREGFVEKRPRGARRPPYHAYVRFGDMSTAEVPEAWLVVLPRSTEWQTTRGDWAAADPSKARLYFPHYVQEFADATIAYQLWLGLDPRVPAAFRSAGETTPVYPHDLVYRL